MFVLLLILKSFQSSECVIRITFPTSNRTNSFELRTNTCTGIRYTTPIQQDPNETNLT
jgi:hypothetical protein